MVVEGKENKEAASEKERRDPSELGREAKGSSLRVAVGVKWEDGALESPKGSYD